MRSKFVAVGAMVGAFVTALAVPALAHVTIQPSEAPAGGFQTFVVQVPNESEKAATTKIVLQLPPFGSVRFQDVPGWDRQVKNTKFDEPIELFGEEVTEGVGTVTWSGGEIAPGEFATFGFSAGAVPEGEVEFRAIQTYDDGEVRRWIEAADGESPAPRITGVTLGGEEGQGTLTVVSELKEQVAALEAELESAGSDSGAAPEAADDDDDEGDDDSDTGVLLGGVGIGVGVIALLVALMRKK
jgi:uncharacterized protein YcnI